MRALGGKCLGPASWPLWAAVAALLYIALAVLNTYPLIAHLDSGVLRGIDTGDALQQTWVLAWVQHALQHNPSGFWDAPIFYPTRDTLAFHDNLAPLAIATLPLAGLVHNPLIVYNCAVIASYPLCGLAMFTLAYVLNADGRAALLAGAIYAFCPYRERHIEHLNLLSAEAIPLIILAFELGRTRGGAVRWGALGLALCLSATLSLYYTAFTLLALGLYILVLLFTKQVVIARPAWRGVWALLPMAAALLWLIGPYLGAQRNVGSERRLQDIVYFSADVRDYLHTGPQSLLYGWSDRLWHISSLDIRQYLFPGWTALALAAFGTLWAGKRRLGTVEAAGRATARPYLAVAALLVVLSLGPYLRLFGTFTRLPMPYLAIYTLPGFGGFRDIGRYDQVAMAFVAGAAAVGAARLLTTIPRRHAGWLLLGLLGAVCAESLVVQRPLLPVASGPAIPAVYRWLAGQPRGPVAELPMCGSLGPWCGEESTYMYNSTYHWQPLLNGGGGFFPPGWSEQITAINSFPSPHALTTLARIGARYLVIHADAPSYRVLLPHAPSAPITTDSRPLRVPGGSPAAWAGASTVAAHPGNGWVTVDNARLLIRRIGPDIVLTLPKPGS